MRLIFSYLLNPVIYTSFTQEKPNSKIKTFLSSLIFVIVGVLSWAILITVVNNLNLIISGKAVLRELLHDQSHDLLNAHSRPVYILILTILAPIYEELEFRLFLDLKRSSLIISFSLFIFFLIVPIWFLHISELVNYLSILGIIFIFNYFLFQPKFITKLKRIDFKFIFYFSVLIFSFIHIFNFKPLTFTKIILSPILVFPQIIGGIALGYLRIKNGILWTVFLHIIINSMGLLLFPL